MEGKDFMVSLLIRFWAKSAHVCKWQSALVLVTHTRHQCWLSIGKLYSPLSIDVSVYLRVANKPSSNLSASLSFNPFICDNIWRVGCGVFWREREEIGDAIWLFLSSMSLCFYGHVVSSKTNWPQGRIHTYRTSTHTVWAHIVWKRLTMFFYSFKCA